MPLPPEEYAKILKEKIYTHDVDCWLVNTGWTGGPYGTGKRIALHITREIIDNILNGSLTDAAYIPHDATGFLIPAIQYIPMNILYPSKGWDNIKNYNKQAKRLMTMMKTA